jgi:hypothetical protein
MRVAIISTGTPTLSMALLIAYASATGSFGSEGGALLALAWGKVTLADLYLGFALFSGWVIFREARRATALVCVALVMTLLHDADSSSAATPRGNGAAVAKPRARC